MIRMNKWGAGIASLGILMGSAALADDTSENRENKLDAQVTERVTNQTGPTEGRLDKIRSASELMGHDLVNQADEKLGSIEDIVIDEKGKAHYVVIGHGGLIASDRFIAIPWNVLKPNFDGEDCRIDMTEAKLKQSPYFTKETYHTPWTSEWKQKVHSFYGDQAATSDAADRVVDPNVEGQAAAQQSQQRMYYASQLVGGTVQNAKEEKLASIDDVLFDARGQAVYAIIGHGGILSIGESDIAVPWQAMTLRAGEQGNVFAMLDMTTEQLEKAPTLEKDNYADLLEQGYADSTRRYFNLGEREEIEAETPNPEERAPERQND